MSNRIVTRTVVGAMVTIAVAVLLASAVASAGQFSERIYQAGAYPNSEDRQYTVYVPDSYDGATPVPLVVVLHGCNQTHRVAFDEQGWDKTADANGFIVLAPFVTSYEGLRNPNCWGWWSAFDYEVHEGGGEIEDIYRIALEVEGQYNIDPNQRHITGLSAGGFMANVAAVTHNVVDPELNHAPSLALNGGSSIHVRLGGTFDDPGATATDAEDGDLTDAITISGSVDTGTAGTYTIRYSVTDSGKTASGSLSSEKSATVTRTVLVEDVYCEAFGSSTYGHVIAGRASVCNGWYACAIGSGESLGFNNIFVTTTLYEAPQGYFSTTPCRAGAAGEGGDETVCWTDTNYRHAVAGRAAYRFVFGLGYAYLAMGSNENLGYLGSALVSLRKAGPDYYERVNNCP